MQEIRGGGMLETKHYCDVDRARHLAWFQVWSAPLPRWWNALLSAPGLYLARTIDGTLVTLLLVTSFLMGCCHLYDSDVWWHLRGGQWILEHGRVPSLDPFTFGSADRVWVDLSWTFQILLAFLYQRGGVAALMLSTAAVGTLALAILAAARHKSWPLALSVLCLSPALVLMSDRFRPRPEVFSMLYLASFLAVLWHAGQRPKLLWLLPPLQILWVNTHALFILGPIVLGFFALDKAVASVCRRYTTSTPTGPEYKRIAAVAALVLLACLANPYLLDGALFPMLLFPKVTFSGNIYKDYISEFHSPRDFALSSSFSMGAYYRACFLLLLVLPISFILPTAWDAWSRAPDRNPKDSPVMTVPSPGSGDWLLGLGLAVGLTVVVMVMLTGGIGGLWTEVAAPIGCVLLATPGGWLLWHRSRAAAMFIWLGGLFEAAWVSWLRVYFIDSHPLVWFDSSRLQTFSPLIALLTGAALSAEIVLRRGKLFRVLLVVSFAYLGLNATRNTSLFGLVGGAVLAWNLCEWVRLLGRPGRSVFSAGTDWALRLGTAALLAAWALSLANNRYFAWAGEPNRRLGLEELPGVFAHDAACFAGRPGLPERAFVCSIAQAGVYVYHNGPDRKPFIDPRLELPSRENFARYVTIQHWLQEQDPQWPQALHTLGNPLVMLSHEDYRNLRADAALISHPGWRCVYFDALAAIFVPHLDAASEAANPDVDFAGRLFRPEGRPIVPDLAGAGISEARALFEVAMALDPSSKAAQHWRLELLLGVLGRIRQELEASPSSASTLALLGLCHQKLLASAEPPQLMEEWEPARLLPWAKATYCYQHALALAPHNPGFLTLLYTAYSARKMTDAQLAVGQLSLTLTQGTRDLHEEVARLHQQLEQANQRSPAREDTPEAAVAAFLSGQQPERAVRAAEEAQSLYRLSWPWPTADRLAMTYLHLGRPASARRIWEQSLPPSPAIRLCRIASTFWVEQDFERAVHLYRQALAEYPKQAEAYWALTLIYTEVGQAGPALEACNKGLRLRLSDPQRAIMQQLHELLSRYVGC